MKDEFAEKSKHYDDDDDVFFQEKKSQKAKGSYGGGNLVRHRPRKNGSSSILQIPSLLIPNLLFVFACFFLPNFSLFIL